MPRDSVIHVPPTKLDRVVADACYRLATPEIEPPFRVLTWLADEKLMLVCVGAAWLVLRSVSRNRVLRRQTDQMLCSIAIAAAVPHALKLAFVRERPDRTRVRSRRKGIPKSGKAWDSFPSGHAVHVGALAAAVSRMSPGNLVVIWSSAVALASTRVMLLAHYLTDVIAGFMLGIGIDKVVDGTFRITGLNADREDSLRGPSS